MKTNRLLVAAILATAIGAPIGSFAEDNNMSQPVTPEKGPLAFLHGLFASQSAAQTELASLARANAWLNSPPLTTENLRGKVVLINVWTYTCINWLRQLPYVRAWLKNTRIKDWS